MNTCRQALLRSLACQSIHCSTGRGPAPCRAAGHHGQHVRPGSGRCCSIPTARSRHRAGPAPAGSDSTWPAGPPVVLARVGVVEAGAQPQHLAHVDGGGLSVQSEHGPDAAAETRPAYTCPMQTEYLLIAGLLLAVLILQLVALLRRPPHDRLEQAVREERAPAQRTARTARWLRPRVDRSVHPHRSAPGPAARSAGRSARKARAEVADSQQRGAQH